METRRVVLTALILAVAASRQLHVSPNVSTTVFVGNEQQRQSPLVVLRAGSPGGDGAPPPSELEVFSEDPNWNSKVLLCCEIKC